MLGQVFSGRRRSNHAPLVASTDRDPHPRLLLPPALRTCGRSSELDDSPRLPSFTRNVTRWPLRNTTMSTSSPGLCEYNASEYSYRSFTGLPASSTMTSPALSPPTSAGLPAL